MITNDILRRIRYALKLNDTKMLAIFASVENPIDEKYLHSVMAKEGEENYIFCRDSLLCLFLDGLIIEKRGRKEGFKPVLLPGKAIMPNNDILRKLRIALDYKEQDMLQMLELAGFPVSKSELSALFRKPTHRNYKLCGDQLLRNFLNGLTIHLRGTAPAQDV